MTQTQMIDAACGTDEGEQGARRYYGKYAGIVLENAVPDNGVPDGGAHRGQLKVRVPGILEEAPGGGADRPIEVFAAPCFLPGYFFIPEKEAQVWVEFVAGDINFPIWTGVWYPNDAVPTATQDGDGPGDAPTEHQKVIRSPSGQVLQLDDTEGEEMLVVKDEKNKNTIRLNKDGVKIECKQQSGTSTITMDSNGVTVTFGQSTVAIKDSSIEITEGTTVKAKLEASKLTLEGGPTSKVEVGAEGVAITDVTGTARGVVLSPTDLLSWLLTHQHVGNMGAPTPIFPASALELTAKMTQMMSKA